MNTMYVSYYADGAIYDAALYRHQLKEFDDELGNELCVLTIDTYGLPEVERRVLNYAREGNTNGYGDAYMAADAIAAMPRTVIYAGDYHPKRGHCPTCGIQAVGTPRTEHPLYDITVTITLPKCEVKADPVKVADDIYDALHEDDPFSNYLSEYGPDVEVTVVESGAD